MKQTTYIAAELEPVTAHPDQTGKLHATREDAIEANFKDDMRAAVFEMLKQERYEQMPVVNTLHFVRDFIKQHPDFARILVGDRDFT